jgi:hypothetical protein
LPFNFTFEHDNKGLSWYEVDYKKRLEAEEIEKEKQRAVLEQQQIEAK